MKEERKERRKGGRKIKVRKGQRKKEIKQIPFLV